MVTARLDPLRDLVTMQDRINRMFGDALRRDDDEVLTHADWAPVVDIYQTAEHELVLQMEVPGVSRDEIDLRVENDVLTVRGQRPRPTTVSDDQYLRGERRFGAFNRSFRLPPVLDTGRVKAEYRDGVLTVTLPRKEEARPKQIKVDVN